MKKTLTTILMLLPLAVFAWSGASGLPANRGTEAAPSMTDVRTQDDLKVKAGDRYRDFTAKDVEGNEFKLSDMEGKKILLVYGCFSCMGKVFLDFIADLYEKTDREEFEIVHFLLSTSPQEMGIFSEHYKVKYHLVSDFMGENSPTYPHYQQSGKFCSYFINPDGTVAISKDGFMRKELEQMREAGEL